jgi:putative transposase
LPPDKGGDEREFDRFSCAGIATPLFYQGVPFFSAAVELGFYDFPAEHWVHIRTTNPIESTFATVRPRHSKTKGSGTRTACLTMVYKLMESASKKWRALNGSELLPKVIAGVVFVDGVKKSNAA